MCRYPSVAGSCRIRMAFQGGVRETGAGRGPPQLGLTEEEEEQSPEVREDLSVHTHTRSHTHVHMLSITACLTNKAGYLMVVCRAQN